MIDLVIDVDEVIAEFNLPEKTGDLIVVACVEEITKMIHYNWANAAKQGLHSTRNDYINGLVISAPSQFVRTITLKGKLNNMLEEGASAFDLKAGFMKSSKVKYSKKGNWYLTIPFRQAVSTSLGENSAFSNIIPPAVHSVVKALDANKSLPAKAVPSPFDIPKARPAFSVPEKKITFDEYTHKSSIYSGLTKNVGVYAKSTQNTYSSFRRAGELSDTNSWIHRGIMANKFLDKAVKQTDIRTIVDNKVDEILSQIL